MIILSYFLLKPGKTATGICQILTYLVWKKFLQFQISLNEIPFGIKSLFINLHLQFTGMLFNLFGNKEEDTTERIFSDRVYIATNAKMNACLQLAKEQPNSLFIAWFSDTAKKYKDYFIQNGLEETIITEARFIHTAQLQNHTPVFVEHYPLHSKELALVENWQLKNIIVYSAMDEPLFKHFGSDKMIPLIKLLGMKENESIEHSYVTQSITRGQQKIADKVSIEQTANSQADWMERNLGDPLSPPQQGT